MKKFITTISLQGFDLSKTKYQAVENEALAWDNITRFPIIQDIATNAHEGEDIEIIPIIVENENANKNFENFKEELAALKEAVGFNYVINETRTTDSELIESHIKLFLDIISKVNDNDSLYACVTYGTKPMPIIIMVALNYAKSLKKDVIIENVIYGRVMHDRNKEIQDGFLYDVTALFYMNSIINHLAEAKIANPEEALKGILGLR